jgi:hypothetical protein
LGRKISLVVENKKGRMSAEEQIIEQYINNPLKTGLIPPKIRGACRHLIGEYDPVLHAWCNAMVLISTGENIYLRV